MVEDAEMAMSSDAASVDDALGDTLVVESVNLLHGDLVLEKSRTSALGERSLQPEIGCKSRSRRIGKGIMPYHV